MRSSSRRQNLAARQVRSTSGAVFKPDSPQEAGAGAPGAAAAADTSAAAPAAAAASSSKPEAAASGKKRKVGEPRTNWGVGDDLARMTKAVHDWDNKCGDYLDLPEGSQALENFANHAHFASCITDSQSVR